MIINTDILLMVHSIADVDDAIRLLTMIYCMLMVHSIADVDDAILILTMIYADGSLHCRCG